MSEDESPVFQVDTTSEPVILRVQGRANYLNCAPVANFFRKMIAAGKRQFVIDFKECSTMDSTFLGIMAGVALDLRNADPPGDLVVARLGERNLELVHNLGLHRILTVDTGEQIEELRKKAAGEMEALDEKAIKNASLILEAHENLLEVDEGNRGRFQDVISFLKNQVEGDRSAP